MIDFSKMRRRVTLQAPLEVQLNSINEQTPIYQNIATVWAEVSPLSGREYLESQKLQAETSFRVRIRYRNDVQANWQVLYGGKRLYITDVLDTNGLHEELQIMAFEKTPE